MQPHHLPQRLDIWHSRGRPTCRSASTYGIHVADPPVAAPPRTACSRCRRRCRRAPPHTHRPGRGRRRAAHLRRAGSSPGWRL
eukprot:317692-Chlamydomonas_euryale.AAC.1